ncbi:methyl-accepting chemotaxis protein [Vibrio viridaestus]|uniref:Methyl-accepting chemotaxis protein n=1 Tax=Vibrio viridaestus TaxID=2487322 RepID=A0A3N9TEM1_9VIBR|nr:methyl-accepting chemotaxis protein [Vibrio viridaestus]RQW62687.1 methyl-accepting chemotaxis protein [Vibrio viridaestus]
MIQLYKHKSINTQLRGIMLLCLIISFSVIAVLVYRSSAQILLNSILEDHKARVEVIAKTISEQFNEYIDSTKLLESTFEHGYLDNLQIENTSVEFSGHQLNNISHEGSSLVGNYDVVDRFTRDTGAIATIFVQSGNDWLRVSTSLKDTNGQRMVGTVLGQSHPAFEKMRSGQDFYDQVTLFGKRYITYYHPLMKDGQPAAILFIGQPVQKAAETMFQNLSQLKWGETGSTLVVDAHDNSIGTYLLKAPGSSQTSILDERDANGNKIFGQIFEQANGLITYQAKSGDQVHEKYLVFTDIPGWKWKLIGGTYVDEVTQASQELLKLIVIISALVGAATFIIIAAFLSKTIKPLITLSSIMERIRDGEVSMTLSEERTDSKNEIIQLHSSVRSMTTKLNNLVNEIRTTSESVRDKSNGVLDDANQGLRQSEQQQEQIEQIVAAIEEMATSAQGVAEQVEAIAGYVREADENTQSGLELVEGVCIDVAQLNDQLSESASAINQVSQDSGNIQSVTKMIDEIAEQTNLLALNAAIEAARAGEHGRGFAVVADEVRTLAHRTQTSVKDVVDIIDKLNVSTQRAVALMNQSQERANSVMDRSQEAGASLETIAGQVREIATQADTIAATAEQQSVVSQQVAQSATEISELNNLSRNNNAQTAKSSSELDALANNLNKQVEFFH